MNDDLPDPDGPCSRYPLRYGIPSATNAQSLLVEERAAGVRTSVRIPLTAREKSPYVLGNALCDATREYDAV
jgi:hypothetical protein